MADEQVSSSSFVYCHVSHPLTILQTAAAATTAATATDDDDEGESVGNSEGEDDEDNEDLSDDDMGPKKVPAAAAPKKAPAKSGNMDRGCPRQPPPGSHRDKRGGEEACLHLLLDEGRG